MSEHHRYPLMGLAIDPDTRCLQAQLSFVEGAWFATIGDLTNGDRSFGVQPTRQVPLADFLKSAEILFPPIIENRSRRQCLSN